MTVSEAVFLLKISKMLSNLLIVITPPYHRSFWTSGHDVAYTPKTLKKVLKLAGYKVILITYDKASMLYIGNMKLFPSILLKILNIIPIARIKVNLLAVGIPSIRDRMSFNY